LHVKVQCKLCKITNVISYNILREAKGDHLERVHSDQKVLDVIRHRRLVLLFGTKILKANSRDHQARVHIDQMVLVMARREADPLERRPNSRATFS
jgi:hypothetical protein